MGLRWAQSRRLTAGDGRTDWRGRLVQRGFAGFTDRNLSAVAIRSNIRATRAQSLQTLLDLLSNRGGRKFSKKPLQLLFDRSLVTACTRRPSQIVDHGIDFLLCARSVAAWKQALEIGPRTICVDQAHTAESCAATVIGLLVDINRPHRCRIGGLERRAERAIRSITSRVGQCLEVVNIRRDVHGLFAIDDRAWEPTLQTAKVLIWQ